VRPLSDQVASVPSASPVQVRVLGPDWAGPSPNDLRRLFRGSRLTPARRQRLANSGRVVAQCSGRLVGIAAYERVDREIRVHEFGIDQAAPAPLEEIAGTLLDALEVACLAGGGRRLVLLPRAAVAENLLRRRGFSTIAQDCAGSWFEKVFPS
jgi:hypothetical protein